MGEVHCLDVGCADSTVVVSGGATFLVDCGGIEDHVSLLPSSRHIRGVFITHQHADHYSGLSYLSEHGYYIDHLVYSPYERRQGDTSVSLDDWNQFNSLRAHFEKNGTKLHTPFRQSSWDKPWWQTNGVKFWMLGPAPAVAKAATRELHDASLVIKLDAGNLHFCFTGDASDICLDYVANNTKNYCNGVLHVSHHGSLNGASLDFIKKAAAKHVVVSTRSGVHESVPHPTALQRYESVVERVYRTDADGSLKWTF